jgi:hypothetical protein
MRWRFSADPALGKGSKIEPKAGKTGVSDKAGRLAWGLPCQVANAQCIATTTRHENRSMPFPSSAVSLSACLRFVPV